MHPLLSIKDLSIDFAGNGTDTAAVSFINIDIPKGKIVAVVGESGCGKTVTALSILKLLPEKAWIKGEILFSEDGVSLKNLVNLSEKELQGIRGNKIAMVFQEPMTSLNPVFTCGEQVSEVLRQHKKLTRREAGKKTIELFAQVELPDPASILHRYPHQLSGGQKQRVMLAMAMSCNPYLLIADEPTTALDVSVQKNILALLKKIQQQSGLSILLITHDLGIVADVSDEVIVMYRGRIVEQGATANVLNFPVHDYTRALLACRPAANMKGKPLPAISGFRDMKVEDEVSEQISKNSIPADVIEPVLSVRNLKVYFNQSGKIFERARPAFKAVDDVSFKVEQNETLGIVGESGCGKTTLARAIMQLIKPTGGEILLNGLNLAEMNNSVLRENRKKLQIIFQDPYGSLNPRLSIGEAILEPLKVHGFYGNAAARKEKVISLLEEVWLKADQFNRYPHQFSGGQRQRICIARALALQPSFLIFDESVSALDVSIQAQILNLINSLKTKFDFTSLFISHDLSVVHYISDRILVMNKGQVVETGTAEQVYQNPVHAYTQHLLAAMPGRDLQRHT